MKTYFTFDGIKIPVRIKKDWRSSIRYSITRKSINIMLPKHYVGPLLTTEIEKLHAWSIQQFKKDPSLLAQFRAIVYENGEFVKIYGQLFQLVIEKAKRKTASGKVNRQNQILIQVPIGLDQQQESTLIGKLLSRVFSSHFHKDISDRVHYYNKTYFQERIETIRLKNTLSNWGSCSSDNNINLSSRLLFAPTDVLDYVIVHELAHLKEMNHSDRFWKIVRDIMPNYKEKEKWLSKHGETLKF